MAFPAASIVQDVSGAARTLVPLLKNVRARIEPRIAVEPGTLPPSPITGRSSTLFAVRIGVRSRPVDEAVVGAMDRLLRWDPRQPLSAADRDLVTEWLDELQVKVLARLAAAQLPVACDEVCVVQRLTNPDSVFGATAKEQQEARDELLLQALIDAVVESSAASAAASTEVWANTAMLAAAWRVFDHPQQPLDQQRLSYTGSSRARSSAG